MPAILSYVMESVRAPVTDLDLPCKLDLIADIQVDAEVQEISHTWIIPEDKERNQEL